jgi:hypothetical protein
MTSSGSFGRYHGWNSEEESGEYDDKGRESAGLTHASVLAGPMLKDKRRYRKNHELFLPLALI